MRQAAVKRQNPWKEENESWIVSQEFKLVLKFRHGSGNALESLPCLEAMSELRLPPACNIEPKPLSDAKCELF